MKMSEMNKLKQLNLILIKELQDYKCENSTLKLENELLKIGNEELKDKNEKLMAGNTTINNSDHNDTKNQFDPQATTTIGKHKNVNNSIGTNMTNFIIEEEIIEAQIEDSESSAISISNDYL